MNQKQSPEHIKIEQRCTNSNRWLVNISAFVFLIWSFADFKLNDSLAPVFFLIRLIPFTLMVLFASALNLHLFKKHHRVISSTILAIIATSNTVFIALSKEAYNSNLLSLILLLLTSSFYLRANYKFFLPIIVSPMTVFLSLMPFISSASMDTEYSFTKLFIACFVSFISHWTIHNFITKSFNLRLKYGRKDFETKKLLEENNQLIRILCHDLGNALTIIEMTSGILEKRLIPSEEQKLFFEKNIDRLKRAVNNQKEIIEHVKQKEALESGKQKVDLVPVSLNIVFEKVKFIFQDQIKEKNLDLIINYSNDTTPYVMAEMVSLSNNVINNIVSNAIKFSPDNSQIIISTWSDNNTVFLTIEDFGIGMGEDLLKNIFSTTVQTSRPGVKGEKGTGFGMPLAKSYMTKYGGDIIVESRVSRGTRFTLTFDTINQEEQVLPLAS